MSIRVMTRVWEESEQSEGSLLVLLAMADHADDAGICFPSQERLAQRARLSVRQVRRIIDALVAESEVKIIREGVGRGKRTVYKILTGSSLVKEDNMSAFSKPVKADIGDTKKRTLESPSKYKEPSLEPPIRSGSISSEVVHKPTGNKATDKATDKAAAMEALSGQADRVAQIFKRRANTPWSEKEVIAWKKLLKAGPLDDAELAMVERYYAGNRRKSDSICRTSLLTFLTHFHGEIDRARSWWEKQPAAKKPKPPPPVRILDDVIEPEKAQPLPDPNEPATKVFLENYALHHEGRLPYGYAREGTKIVFVTDGQAK